MYNEIHLTKYWDKTYPRKQFIDKVISCNKSCRRFVKSLHEYCIKYVHQTYVINVI